MNGCAVTSDTGYTAARRYSDTHSEFPISSVINTDVTRAETRLDRVTPRTSTSKLISMDLMDSVPNNKSGSSKNRTFTYLKLFTHFCLILKCFLFKSSFVFRWRGTKIYGLISWFFMARNVEKNPKSELNRKSRIKKWNKSTAKLKQ